MIGIVLITLNCIISYKGFTNTLFMDGYKFEIDSILIRKDYIRLISSGFLHVSWIHLIFNMMSLYAFSGILEIQLGWLYFLLLYLVSLIGGNLFALYIHKNHGDYSAVGASGAISGIIFACIALYPGLGIGFFGLNFSIPSYIYGPLYILYTIYGIKSNRDNIGHEAHLGGALVGMLVALVLVPSAFLANYLTILLVLLPTLVFIYLIINKPEIMLIDSYYFKTDKKQHYTIDHKYNENKVNKQKELDNLLDKISKKGIQSLTQEEKKKLDELSR